MIQSIKCIPGPSTCIGQAQNGTGMSWFDMQNECLKTGSRLAWIREDMGIKGLANSIHVVGYHYVFMGMLTDGISMFQTRPNPSK